MAMTSLAEIEKWKESLDTNDPFQAEVYGKVNWLIHNLKMVLADNVRQAENAALKSCDSNVQK